MNILIFFARLLTWLIPFLIAIGALAGLGPWVLGIPGDPNAGYAQGWWIGLFALGGYLAAYAAFLIVWLVARLLGIPALASFAHGIVWIAVLALAVAQYIAWTKMLAA